ncbi:TonB-dependent receptor [Rhizomicrobium electricum]|uniref:TonB-dependent receptor n=1 Tax=Rhizomicrobium electricum TaxID=480070 RepID=A0ABP3PD10_9PROT|nr:TonB-dependent receptor [Rhizomicrobium electricum]NIJ48643.1 TonB-dependent receptor [Rhizomicrobium electricum]
MENQFRRLLKLGVCAAVLGAVPASAQDTQQMEVVTVTGFRGSLEKALDVKRNSASAVDTIMAEDIAKFPDLNLSESLQRVPGVAISRDAGEGRQLSVRGLGGGFTRTLVNGMELLSTGGGTDASGGTNRTRTFDFNVFASDLFNQIDVEKTSMSETEEGSLGSTVKLYTAHPLDIDGFKLAASAKAGYNDLSHTYSPRFSALISDTFFGGKLGVLFSGAFVNRDLLDEGFSTVRWAGGASPVANGFRSVSGVSYNGTALTTTDFNSSAASTVFHPRIPRLDKYVDKQHRTGFTGSVQYKPDDATLFTLDALYANFGGTREEQFLESFTFQQTGVCGPTSPASCGINQVDIVGGTVIEPRSGVRELVAGTFNNVDAKSERRHDKLMTEVYQVTLAGTHSFSNNFTVKGFLGFNSSVFANSEQTTMQFDQYNVQNYKYDFSTPFPTITYGSADLMSSTAWQLVEIRLNPNWVYNRDTQAQINAEWKVMTGLTLKAGLNWVEAKNRAVTFNRSNGTNASRGAVLPTGVPALSTVGMTETFNLPSQPSGNPTKFFAPNIMAGIEALHLYDSTYQSAQTVIANTTWVSPFKSTCFTTAGCGVFNVGPESALGSNYTVQENALGGYLQADFDTDLWGVPVRGNFGTRVVQTIQNSLGYGVLTTKSGAITTNTITPSTYHRVYADVLPSFNIVVEPIENLLFRVSGAKVMSRPGLGSLNPGVTLSVSGNKTATAGNPEIKPYRAKTFDLSAEWYFAKGGLISVAGFYKEVGTFVQTYTSPQSVFSANPWGLPDSQADAACGTLAGCSANSVVWTFSYPINTPGGPVKGIEINYQQPFTFLPGPFDRFGAIFNLTLVTSKIKYLNASGAVSAVDQLTNLSQRSWNATLYYEDDALSARVSAAYRSKYLTQVPGRNGSDVEGTAPTLNVDASITYTIDENWALTLEGLNLTNQRQSQYFDSSEMLSFKHMTGREFLAGVRFNF